jgi:hypothetical protein
VPGALRGLRGWGGLAGPTRPNRCGAAMPGTARPAPRGVWGHPRGKFPFPPLASHSSLHLCFVYLKLEASTCTANPGPPSSAVVGSTGQALTFLLGPKLQHPQTRLCKCGVSRGALGPVGLTGSRCVEDSCEGLLRGARGSRP